MPPQADSADSHPERARSTNAPNSLTDEVADRLESYRELIDCAHAIVWRADVHTLQFTFVSGYAETLLGYPLEHWTDEPAFWKDHIDPDDREWAVALCLDAIQEKRTHEIEYRMIAADGHAIWLRDIVRVVTENDQPRELVGVMVDITARKNAEQALQRSEGRLRQAIDTIPQQIWSGPADGSVDFCNARWRNELGLSLEDLSGDGWQKMLHPDDRDRVLQAWRESVANGMPYEQQERHCMATGEYRWFLSRGVPLRDENGEIVRWFGSNTDIDEQKKAEDALRQSERRWHGVFDNSKIPVALQDSSLRYVEANAAFCQMVGYRLDELQKMTCLDITYEEDRERYKSMVDELISGKRDHFELEKRYRRKDGELVWSRLNGSSIGEADSPLWVVMAEDIAERKRLGDQLQQERDRLRLLLDVSNTFVSKLSLHDFFDALAESLREIEDWEYSFVALPESAARLKVHLVGGSTGELKVGTSVPIGGTIAGDVYRSGQLQFFRIADLLPVPNYPELTSWREFARAEGLQVGCNLPLRYDGKVLGVLGFHTRNDLKSAREDLGFLQELAKLVALALHNALRYGELSESHEKLVYEKKYIEDEIRSEFGVESMIGKSKGLRDVLKEVDAVAPTDTTVLVVGETGTGKELIARAIHDRSPRHDHSFIKVDCAAIPAALMESELFGHEKGAFTGATTQKHGRFELADHGTLFLDEVGDIPSELQPKLLRVLQDHAFERLGSNRTRRVDVRVIAATHRDMAKMVEQGNFREDLYYRLKVFPVVIPPLRDRSSDIPGLVKYYVAKYARRMKKEVPTVPQSATEVFLRYPWPGNVRELQHFIERSVVLTSGRLLQAPLSELQEFIRRRANRPPAPLASLKILSASQSFRR